MTDKESYNQRMNLYITQLEQSVEDDQLCIDYYTKKIELFQRGLENHRQFFETTSNEIVRAKNNIAQYNKDNPD